MMIVIVKDTAILANDSKQRMIQRAAVLLAKKGLQGASFSEVLAASGAPRGSVYHHFPGGKEELVLAAVVAAGEQAMAVLQTLDGKPAVEVARTFLDLWRTVLVRSNFGAGCAIVAVTIAAEAPALRLSAAEIFQKWRRRLAELFVNGGVPAARAPAIAATLLAACEGAVILSRAEQSFEPFDQVAAEQLSMIEAVINHRRRAPI
jgi:TetR/AcrR family transcriptional regulator, lmrAB and yxaGH operons repressor